MTVSTAETFRLPALPTLARAVEAFLRGAERPQVFMPLPGGDRGMGAGREVSGFDVLELLPPDGPSPERAWSALYDPWGSWWPGRLVVLVGGTGRGKSSWALQAAEAAASDGHPVVYMSAEMDTDELVARLVALRARSPAQGYGFGPAWADVEMYRQGRAVEVATELLMAECPSLYLWAPPLAERGGACLASMARAVSAAHAGRSPFIVVDYVQRMIPPGGGDAGLRSEVSRLSGELRALSRAEGDWPGAAILALSTTARAHYALFDSCRTLEVALEGGLKGGKDVPPVDLVGLGKESGELEADAPAVLNLTTDDGDGDEPRRALLAWSKNRHGVRKGKARLSFWPACGRFQVDDRDTSHPDLGGGPCEVKKPWGRNP